jgi:hypothetical protein
MPTPAPEYPTPPPSPAPLQEQAEKFGEDFAELAPAQQESRKKVVEE